jgi:hypothetical protein
MPDPKQETVRALAGLKDFQRRTVDYVFDRLFVSGESNRFLVADEVGLGKTLVARGVIARAIEHLKEKGDRIDVIYVCSNAAIAKQNVNRLNVLERDAFSISTRLTMLPVQVKDLVKNPINFISLTPGTTFDLKSSGGQYQERILLYRMLRNSPWARGTGFLNMLQGRVSDRDGWRRLARQKQDMDSEIVSAFCRAVDEDAELVDRITRCCETFSRFRRKIPYEESRERYAVIGMLRQLLARACIDALKPDLVILDEFQRFKDLLSGESEAANLSRVLFDYPGVRTLLLSATPYKMLSLDHDDADDHYTDFLRTIEFLSGNSAGAAAVSDSITQYRKALFSSADESRNDIETARNRLQESLLSVMCRTERVGMTRRLDAMVEDVVGRHLPTAADLDHAVVADRAARAVGAYEPIEYWKSAPYLLNFLRHYDLRRRIDAMADAPSDDLLAALRTGRRQILRETTFDRYDKIEFANARLRALVSDTIDKGLWRLLWMPPSLSYVEPSGPYADVGSVTKALVFSAWNAVPDAISTLVSYEAERRALEGLHREISHSELYDRLKPLLRFTIANDRPTGMPALACLLPSPVLAEAVDPLEIALRLGDGEPISQESLVEEVQKVCSALLDGISLTRDGARDERWYWAAPAILAASTELPNWIRANQGWTSPDEKHESGEGFKKHVAHLLATLESPADLERAPEDLAHVLAEMALGGPGTCALRALRRIAPDLAWDDSVLLSAAAKIAGGFRSLYNIPESMAILRAGALESQEDEDDTYWRLILRYGIDGNLQALLDEQVHMLLESEGLAQHDSIKRVEGVADALTASLSLHTSRIKIDELRPNGQRIERNEFTTRCRFAVRFGDLKDDQGAALARASTVRDAFNSPFRPFVLASTSIGQEGLDFHTWCHAVVHWNLPTNPVDLEQREGRVHRYKGHAVRKNIAEGLGLRSLRGWIGAGDPWQHLFAVAESQRESGHSELSPFWIFEEGSSRIERRVPLLVYSKEVQQLERLKKSLALYRLVFGQPRQEDLLTYLADRMTADKARDAGQEWRISLEPPAVTR